MKKCTIVCGYKPSIKNELKGKIIGVDKGCLYLIKNNFKIDVAIGDFDSVTKKEFELIRNNSKKLIKLNPIKDDTDFEHTLNYVKENKYTDVDVYGVLNGRKDHEILNLKLLYLSDLNITFYDSKNKIFKLEKGEYKIRKDSYKYFSLLTFDSCRLDLDKVKYPLHNKEITYKDNYTTSNEILDDYCLINIKQGKLLIILCND